MARAPTLDAEAPLRAVEAIGRAYRIGRVDRRCAAHGLILVVALCLGMCHVAEV